MRDYVQKQLSPQTWIERLSVSQLAGIVLLLFVISASMFLLDRNRAIQLEYVPETTADFSLLHVYHDVALLSAPVIVGDTAVFAGTLSPEQLPVIISFDIPSGTINWTVDIDTQSEPDWWINDFEWNYPFRWQWGPVTADETAVYIADRFLLTTSVTAYDLATGDYLWQRQIGTINGSQIRSLNLIDGQLAARIIEPSYTDLYVMDTSNGFRVFRENENAQGLFWIDQFEDVERQYRAISIGLEATAVNPWAFQINNCGLTPQMQADRIVVHSLLCDESGRGVMFALDRWTGATLWRLDVPVVSQMALDEDTGFVVSQDNQLLAVDLTNGAVLSILNFDHPIRGFTEETPIFVGAGGGKTAVYYGMNHQLLFFDSVFKNEAEEIEE